MRRLRAGVYMLLEVKLVKALKRLLPSSKTSEIVAKLKAIDVKLGEKEPPGNFWARGYYTGKILATLATV